MLDVRMTEIGRERDEVARDTLPPCRTLLKHARRKSVTQVMDAWTAQSALTNACFSQDNQEGGCGRAVSSAACRQPTGTA